MDENPYASPKTASEFVDSIVLGEKVYGIPSRWKRFVTFLLDLFLICVVNTATLLLLVVAYFRTPLRDTDWFIFSPAVSKFAPGLLLVGLYFLYFISSEYRWGRSPGKLLTRTRVVRTDGHHPKLGQIIGRTALRLIPYEGLTIFVSANRICLHDWLSGTRVVLDD